MTDASTTTAGDLSDPLVAAGRLLHHALLLKLPRRNDETGVYADLIRRAVQDKAFHDTFERVATGAGYRVLAVTPTLGVLLGAAPDSGNAAPIDTLVDKRAKGAAGDLRVLTGAMLLGIMAAAYPASSTDGLGLQGQDFSAKDVIDVVARLSEVKRGDDGVEDVEADLGETVAKLVRSLPGETDGARRGSRSLREIALKCVEHLVGRGLLVKVQHVRDDPDEALVRYAPQPALGLLVADAGQRVFVEHMRGISARLSTARFKGTN